MEIVDFVKKLESILSFYQLSASVFADKIGFQRSSMSHLLAGRNKPSLDFVMKVTTTFGEVDINWFLFDIGIFPKLKDNDTLADEELKLRNDKLSLVNIKLRQELEAVLLKLSQLESQATLFSATDSQLDVENNALKAKVDNLTNQLLSFEREKSNFDLLIDSQSLKTLKEGNNLLQSEILELRAALDKSEKANFAIQKIQHELESGKKRNKELLLINDNINSKLSELQELIELKSLDLENFRIKNEQLIANHKIFELKIQGFISKIIDLETYQAEILTENEALKMKTNHEKAPEAEITQTLNDDNLKSDIESVMLLLKNGRFKEYRR